MGTIVLRVRFGDYKLQRYQEQVVDHLSRLSNEKFQREKREIEDGFSDKQLFCVEVKEPMVCQHCQLYNMQDITTKL